MRLLLAILLVFCFASFGIADDSAQKITPAQKVDCTQKECVVVVPSCGVIYCGRSTPQKTTTAQKVTPAQTNVNVKSPAQTNVNVKSPAQKAPAQKAAFEGRVLARRGLFGFLRRR